MIEEKKTNKPHKTAFLVGAVSGSLSDKQKFVIDYLKSIYDTDLEINGAWASPTLVGLVYGIKFLGKDNCHSSTGSPILKKLVELGYVERNERGWYRFLSNYRITTR